MLVLGSQEGFYFDADIYSSSITMPPICASDALQGNPWIKQVVDSYDAPSSL